MYLSRRTCLAMGLALGLSACMGSNSPFKVVEKFYAAVVADDVDQAISYLALQQVSANEMQIVKPKVQLMMAQGRARIEANSGLDTVKLLQEQMAEDGETAQVRVQVLFKNGKSIEESFRLLKEDGVWKIRL